MAHVLRMPGVAANATEAVLAEWLVAESAEFAAADALATVETDKALVDVEAEAAGVVLKTLVAAGSNVEVGAPIAVLAGVGERVDDLAALLRELGVAEDSVPVLTEPLDAPGQPVARTEPEVDPGSGAPVVEAAPEAGVESAEPASAAAPEAGPGAAARPQGRIFASPLARKIASDAGLAIEEIPGTGPRHRVLRRDVDALLASRRAAPTSAPTLRRPGRPVPASVPATPQASPAAGFEDVPHTRLRRAVAERLATSKREAPHFYVRTTVRVERLLALRAELNEALDGEVKVSVNDLVVKAVALAHERVPDLNVDLGRRRRTPLAHRRHRGRRRHRPRTRDPRAPRRRAPLGLLGGRWRARARRPRPGGTAPPGGARGWLDHRHQPRHVRRRGVRRDHQPAARRDPGGRCGARGARRARTGPSSPAP